jgi:hypothetical protein
MYLALRFRSPFPFFGATPPPMFGPEPPGWRNPGTGNSNGGTNPWGSTRDSHYAPSNSWNNPNIPTNALSFAFVIVNLGSILEVGFLDDVEFGAGWVIPN